MQKVRGPSMAADHEVPDRSWRDDPVETEEALSTAKPGGPSLKAKEKDRNSETQEDRGGPQVSAPTEAARELRPLNYSTDVARSGVKGINCTGSTARGSLPRKIQRGASAPSSMSG